MTRTSVAAVILLLAAAGPAHARAMYGKAALIVRDEITRAPLEGVRVTMNYAAPAEETRDAEKMEARENTGVTDASGYTAARVYVGRSQTRWEPLFGGHRQKQVDIHAVRICARKPGYKTLDAASGVFFVSFRKGMGTYVFLD